MERNPSDPLRSNRRVCQGRKTLAGRPRVLPTIPKVRFGTMTNEANQPQKTNGQPTRLVRTLSRTRKEGEDYRKDIATIGTDLPPGIDVLESLDWLARTLEAHLSSQKPSGESKPSLDPGQVEGLAWTPYREGHTAGWIFTDKAPKPLVELLERGPVTLGRFSYKHSGPEEKPKLFVSRAPVKE